MLISSVYGPWSLRRAAQPSASHQDAATGLKLLGFKAGTCLQSWHRTQESKFVYPNERALPGSTSLFVVLHNRMLARKVRRRRTSQPLRSKGVIVAREAVHLERRGRTRTAPAVAASSSEDLRAHGVTRSLSGRQAFNAWPVKAHNALHRGVAVSGSRPDCR